MDSKVRFLSLLRKAFGIIQDYLSCETKTKAELAVKIIEGITETKKVSIVEKQIKLTQEELLKEYYELLEKCKEVFIR